MLPLVELVRHVRRQRLLLGLTQSQLASDAATSQSLVAKLEQGRLNPSYETVRRILEALERHRTGEEPAARDLMQQEPLYAAPEETLGTVLARMKSHGFSQLPVLQGGQAVGSVSEKAILERIEAGESLERLKLQRVGRGMAGAFPTVDPQTSRRTLVELLRETDAVLVTDAARVVGVVTKSDLW